MKCKEKAYAKTLHHTETEKEKNKLFIQEVSL